MGSFVPFLRRLFLRTRIVIFQVFIIVPHKEAIKIGGEMKMAHVNVLKSLNHCCELFLLPSLSIYH